MLVSSFNLSQSFNYMPSFCIWTLHGLSYLRLILGDPRQALAESRLHLRHVVVQVCPRGPRLSLEALKAVCVQFPSGSILLVLDLHQKMQILD
jgi:hypothetical protein